MVAAPSQDQSRRGHHGSADEQDGRRKLCVIGKSLLAVGLWWRGGGGLWVAVPGARDMEIGSAVIERRAGATLLRDGGRGSLEVVMTIVERRA